VVCEIFFRKLNASKIAYAVMRNYDSLPQSTGGSDLDILFCLKDADTVKKIVLEAFIADGGVSIGHGHTPGFSKYFAFGSQGLKKNWWGIRLDLSFGHVFRGCASLLDTDLVLRDAAVHNGIHILPGPLADVLGVAKELLHNSRKPDRYAIGAEEAFRSGSSYLERALAPIGPAAFAILEEICTNDLEPAQLRHRCRALRALILMHAFRRAPVSFLRRRLYYEASKVKRFISPPGLTLAVLGTDGAGKSTIINAIAPILEEATHGAFYRRHLRPGLLPPLGRLRGVKTDGAPVISPHSARPSGLLGSWLRICWLWLDYVAGYWLIVRPRIAKSPAVFLFDRYAHDLYLDPRRFRIGLTGRTVGFVLRLMPQPNLVICLHGDPETVVARKGELPLDEVRRQTTALQRLASVTPGAVLISTNGSVEETRDAVLDAIMAYLSTRYEDGG
jgi:energy-coupling factor transporter ATP-binding protein EcfA2